MEFETEVEFTGDCWWSKYTYDTPDHEMSGYEKVKKGERRKSSGNMNFEKTENGWRAQP
jgi:hypothetical protein